MALRCVGRYRNLALALYVEPGEVLRDLDPETEALLLRDSPGSFVVVGEVKARALAAPPRDKMLRREEAARKESERGREEPMTRRDQAAIVRLGR